VTNWEPSSTYDLWHDRATFHFLTEPADRDAYVVCLKKAVRAGGHVIIATFASDGPERCSGLPIMRYEPETTPRSGPSSIWSNPGATITLPRATTRSIFSSAVSCEDEAVSTEWVPMKRILTTAALLLATGSAFAESPYQGMQSRTVKALSEQQVADLNEGRGMGMALAGELNGYPGPSHVLELADKLVLRPDQISAVRGLFESMKQECIPLGTKLIEQEGELDRQLCAPSLRKVSGPRPPPSLAHKVNSGKPTSNAICPPPRYSILDRSSGMPA
jgi:hypothetical protein